MGCPRSDGNGPTHREDRSVCLFFVKFKGPLCVRVCVLCVCVCVVCVCVVCVVCVSVCVCVCVLVCICV